MDISDKRKTVSLVDIQSLPWNIINDNLSYKHLNGDIDNGEHTVILRSRPRKPTTNFAHYHPINEEFYCLDGEFTFDGTSWFKQGGYAYYPAYFVHGAAVHIKKGYQLYLRTNGKAVFEIINNPNTKKPYILENYKSFSDLIEIQNINNYIFEYPNNNTDGIKKVRLSYDHHSKTGSSIISFEKDFEGRKFIISSNNIVEIFCVEGEFKDSSMRSMYKNMYQCKINETINLEFECIKHGKLLISHGKNLKINI